MIRLHQPRWGDTLMDRINDPWEGNAPLESEARYRGVCKAQCGDIIRPGDRIITYFGVTTHKRCFEGE